MVEVIIDLHLEYSVMGPYNVNKHHPKTHTTQNKGQVALIPWLSKGRPWIYTHKTPTSFSLDQNTDMVDIECGIIPQLSNLIILGQDFAKAAHLRARREPGDPTSADYFLWDQPIKTDRLRIHHRLIK